MLLGGTLATACDAAPPLPPPAVEDPTPAFRNTREAVAYVGDDACGSCHAAEAAAYATNTMARSFHPWSSELRIEELLAQPLYHAPTGLYYDVVAVGDTLYQEEFLMRPDGSRMHELRRRMDHVMGSGSIARTYFTEENGRLFQLPLTWYRDKGWDFSPGYEINNPRFDRLMPDGCIACHGSYPEPLPYLEGKYALLRPGIGCERCHGPGALHVRERTAAVPVDSAYDATIVNPRHLSIERRLDVCEQCHVHTAVTVLREGEDAFSYRPAEPLADHAAFFKPGGGIDIVSHADRLRQSACFLATRAGGRPLECATCHDPHGTRSEAGASVVCRTCHSPEAIRQQLGPAPAAADHAESADCVECHMPEVKERGVPHGTFTDHWIRVVEATEPDAPRRRRGEPPVEPYYERDRSGPDATLYQAMGEVVYASRASDAAVLRRAADELRDAVDSDTSRPDAQFMLGLAYRQLGRHDEAIEAFERSRAGKPDRPELLHALAKSLEATGRPAEEIEALYQRALAVQPALAWMRADYAAFLQAEGRRIEAEAEYRAALAEQPSLAVAAFNLGTLLAAWGRPTEAAEAFQTAVDRDPSLGEALSPLVEVRTTGPTVTEVRLLGSPLTTLPVRGRGPDAVQVTVRGLGGERELLLVNTPRGARVRILRPDGAVMRVLTARDDPTLAWDMLTDRRTPIPGGLYYVEVQVPDGGSRSRPPQRFALGVVRLTRL